MTRYFQTLTAIASLLFGVLSLSAQVTLDGQGIPAESWNLLATQDSATGFGDATVGNQSAIVSAPDGGSELNQLYGRITGNSLEIGITGNLQANYNKLFIFFDAVPGGESTLAGDNQDAGNGEINQLAGLSFGNGATMDHGLRVEAGNPDDFWGVNFFDLIDNTAFSVASGRGAVDLPLTGVAGSGGIGFGWDNSNTAGVTGSDASAAATATTGWEFSIDMSNAFGGVPTQPVGMTVLIANADGTFVSNQFLPGLGQGNSPANVEGDIDAVTAGAATLTAIPEPSACAGMAGLLVLLVAGSCRRE